MRALVVLAVLSSCGRSSLLPPEAEPAPVGLTSAPVVIDYGRSWLAALRGAPLVPGPLTPEVLGGRPTAFSAAPELPPGLDLDADSGTLSGVPVDLLPPTEFEITGTNAFGSASTSIELEVLDGYQVDSVVDARATGDISDDLCASDHDGVSTTPPICTLRAAVEESRTVGRRIVVVPAATLSLTEGDLGLDAPVVIAGSSGATLSGSSNNGQRALIISNETAIQDLTLRDFESEDSGYVIRVAGTSAHLRATHLTIRDSQSMGFDGAIFVTNGGALTAERSTFINNSSDDDAAIWASSTARMELDACLFAFNQVSHWAGAVTAGQQVTARVTRCLFLQNAGNLRAGALQILDSAEVTVENNTFIGNSATVGRGGAIYLSGNLLRLRNNTFLDHSADAAEGNTVWVESGTVEMAGNLLARAPDHCGGVIQSLGGNVSDRVASDCNLGAADITEADSSLLVGELADHGGGIRTVVLPEGSVAIDATADCPATDARGVPRSTPCDAGAFERHSFD